MANKIYKVAILGVGARGGDAYGKLLNEDSERFDIVALCDLRKERLERFSQQFNVKPENCFTDEEEFFKEKRADLLLVTTQDKDHVRHAIKAFETGYDILLEKPVSDNKEECENLLKAQRKAGKKALVCHVLRYAPAFVKCKELIDAGEIGKLISINALERVAFWHQGHSYVRGHWRNTSIASPMILAKSCHDLDLLQWYAGSKCKSLSSVGKLNYFTAENAPEGATKRCLDCPHVDSCPYSAKTIYVGRWHNDGKPEDRWPFNVACPAPVTEEKMLKNLETNDWGRCVFHCDNNVVDNQMVMMTFENGVTAEFTMTAFTAHGYRRLTFFGTHGDITMDEEQVHLRRFGGKWETFSHKELNEGGYDHGGGDHAMMNTLYAMLEGKADLETSLEASIESHLMGIYAEESRLNDGKLVYVHDEK